MMSNPADYRPNTQDIPTQAGVYRFLDATGRVIYVGKAKNLRNRLVNYFQPLESLHPRTQKMVTSAVAVKWVVVPDELAALTLEYAWIKEYQPRYNVMYRDDKSYPYMAINLDHDYPRLYLTRERKRKNTCYFGPYTKVWILRDTIEKIRQVFPLRTCSNGVFNRAKAQQRPCLEGYIDKCSAPCVQRISVADYREMLDQLQDFLNGKEQKFITQIQREMLAASEQLDFEKAAKLRDQIQALEAILAKNTLVMDEKINADVYATAQDELEMTIQAFYIRGGRIRGEKGWVVGIEADMSRAELLENFFSYHYSEYGQNQETLNPLAISGVNPQGKALPEVSAATPKTAASRIVKEKPRSVDDIAHIPVSALPPQIWVEELPSNLNLLESWLSQIRSAKVSFIVPKRGPKQDLLKTVQENAAQALKIHKNRRIGDLTRRSQALKEIQEYLGLAQAPLRIEGYDISHTSGTSQVASMVVFEDGIPKKNQYRTFNIKSNRENHADDTQAMREVLQRRFQRLAKEQAEHADNLHSGEVTAKELTRFSYAPDLVVVDGGLPQVNAAAAALEEIGAQVEVIGLAKRLEEIWLPELPYPIILPRKSAALYLLQHLRDESHRFAITAHRKKRDRKVKHSLLDDIEGIGTKRAQQLLKHFGSLKQLRQASIAEIASLPNWGQKRAEKLYSALHKLDPEVSEDQSLESELDK